MTTVYFIRHAESDTSVRDDATRPLTEAGERAAASLPRAFEGVMLDAIYSSPYLRAMRTVAPLASERGLTVIQEPDFRERKVDGGWIEDWEDHSRREWEDFGYKRGGGESLGEVQARCLDALWRVLRAESGRAVAIGTHGCALSTILRHYIDGFGREQYMALIPKLPCAYKLVFDGERCVAIDEMPL